MTLFSFEQPCCELENKKCPCGTKRESEAVERLAGKNWGSPKEPTRGGLHGVNLRGKIFARYDN